MLKKSALFVMVFAFLFANYVYAYDVQLQPFQDVDNDYSREPIYMLSALGIINGYGDRTYRPNADLSREEFIKLLVMASPVEAGASVGKLPVDIAGNRWSASYISVAYEREWIHSLLDREGRFSPTKTITREEVAMLVGRSLLESEPESYRRQWLSAGWTKERDSRSFRDHSSINSAMQPYVYYAANRGIMEGDLAGFKPKEPLIRKQAAAVVYRLLDKRVALQPIDFTGFYAIQSYPAIQHMNKLSHVIFGWSHLEYNEAGVAGLNTSTTVNRIPNGFEEPLAAADAANITKELMVFYDNANLKQFLKDKPAQEAFIESLLETLQDPAYSFTGVSIDFEGLLEAESAADYVQFLQHLKGQLVGLTLSVAVPPVYHYKGYDLEAIGRLADTVILMAHDFTHTESRLPSAPLPLVNDAIGMALKSIPKEKLVLGISKQANQWITANGVTGPALSPAIADVERRIAMPDVNSTWAMPYFVWKSTFTDERGSHELYYEDMQSISKKIWLAKHYDLKGVSLWFMGSFTAADWDMIGWQSAR